MESLRNHRVVLLVLLAFVLIKCEVEKKSENEEDLFVPTREWKVVKKGQKLPQGLHIRMNPYSGKTEAKILDDGEKKTKAVQVVKTNEDEPPIVAGNSKISEATLKEALKNIKDDTAAANEDRSEYLSQFRSYEELKRELSDINLNPKSDAELLRELMDKFKELLNAKKIDKLHILSVLEDLDFLVHQYDNAVEFVRLKGFEEVIYKNLNSTVTEIKLESLRLFGSLVSNNAKVQIHALETGSLDFLLRTIALNSDYAVKSRAIFALSSLIRRFPLAQLKFVENAGLNVFLELILSSNDIKIQLKIITLINDLVLEYIEATDDQTYPERALQYNRIDLKRKLKELDWCNYLTILLKNVYQIDSNDHDSLEKVLNAILSVVDDCSHISINSINYILEELRERYSMLLLEGNSSDDKLDVDYYKHMHNLCSTIINYHNILKTYKTEL